MNYIKGYCRTNLDYYNCSLVKVFAAIPNIGDNVQVLYKGNVTTLKVVAVTHKQNGTENNPIPISRSNYTTKTREIKHVYSIVLSV
jgi:hypothetical protein